ncbi:MAG: DUF4143 domain-containing protein [Saprospiraceae bacterium]
MCSRGLPTRKKGWSKPYYWTFFAEVDFPSFKNLESLVVRKKCPVVWVKTPKIYLRDTGLLHALLRVETFRDLQSNPALGASWEAYIVQEIASRLPPRADMYFYRTHDGTEADVVIAFSGIPEVLIEIKYSTTPNPGKGFFIAQQDLGTTRNFVVSPVPKGYPISETASVLSHTELDQIFQKK